MDEAIEKGDIVEHPQTGQLGVVDAVGVNVVRVRVGRRGRTQAWPRTSRVVGCATAPCFCGQPGGRHDPQCSAHPRLLTSEAVPVEVVERLKFTAPPGDFSDAEEDRLIDEVNANPFVQVLESDLDLVKELLGLDPTQDGIAQVIETLGKRSANAVREPGFRCRRCLFRWVAKIDGSGSEERCNRCGNLRPETTAEPVQDLARENEELHAALVERDNKASEYMLRIADLEQRLLRTETALPDAWKEQDDQPLPEDEQIHAAFPTRSGRHDLYGEAMRLVGARYSKGGLVALVNWLLQRAEARSDADLRRLIDEAQADERERCAQRCEIIAEHMSPRFCAGEIRRLSTREKGTT